ncbi:hypothetical protein BCR44DRAFT_1507650 [Catenaria anguillulae PL171]|uniref:Uncharacterized protein n=1 Tax=Catenaria anguillulae PL171 TaxID=765915 RepID=A0A1Y2H3L7_9FUNG|nr:hypothetical protein BCR44DRAFT_1507650 [Catenaria anguillulae PL171]
MTTEPSSTEAAAPVAARPTVALLGHQEPTSTVLPSAGGDSTVTPAPASGFSEPNPTQPRQTMTAHSQPGANTVAPAHCTVQATRDPGAELASPPGAVLNIDSASAATASRTTPVSVPASTAAPSGSTNEMIAVNGDGAHAQQPQPCANEDEESDGDDREYMKPDRGSPAYCINQLPGIPGLEVDGFGIVPLPIVDPSTLLVLPIAAAWRHLAKD